MEQIGDHGHGERSVGGDEQGLVFKRMMAL